MVHNNNYCKMGTGFFGIVLSIASLAIVQIDHVSGENPKNRSIFYVCPPDFIRLGSSCYYFSTYEASWEDAFFKCKERDSNLTSPQRWEDRNLREYLNKPEIEKHERWTGGLYDWEAKAWKWGGEMRTMRYQSFSRMPRLSPEKLQWHCVAMIPELLYRWSPKSCIEKKHFICQTVLRKIRKFDRNRNSQRWNQNDPNEISVPSEYNNDKDNKNLDNEIKPYLSNRHDSNYDNNGIGDKNSVENYNPNDNNVQSSRMDANSIGKSAFAHRQNGKGNNTKIMKRKKKPFPGYKWFKDPQAAYIHNVNALKSGRSGLSSADIDKHLRRLERLRKKEERAKLKRERIRDQKNRRRNMKQGNDDQDSLASEITNKKSRNIINDSENVSKRKGTKKKDKEIIEFKPLLSYDNVTQKTYTMNNQLSALHPKTIVEVHEIIKT